MGGNVSVNRLEERNAGDVVINSFNDLLFKPGETLEKVFNNPVGFITSVADLVENPDRPRLGGPTVAQTTFGGALNEINKPRPDTSGTPATTPKAPPVEDNKDRNRDEDGRTAPPSGKKV